MGGRTTRRPRWMRGLNTAEEIRKSLDYVAPEDREVPDGPSVTQMIGPKQRARIRALEDEVDLAHDARLERLTSSAATQRIRQLEELARKPRSSKSSAAQRALQVQRDMKAARSARSAAAAASDERDAGETPPKPDASE